MHFTACVGHPILKWTRFQEHDNRLPSMIREETNQSGKGSLGTAEPRTRSDDEEATLATLDA